MPPLLGLPRDARRAVVALAAAVAVLATVAATPAEAAVRTASTDHTKGERLRTVPIAKRAWAKPRSVASLPATRIGNLTTGDRIRATGEAQLTVCLKPNPRHRGAGKPCVGKMYGFNPTIRARLVLAPTAAAAGPGRTRAISETVSQTCTQKQPARNHHCVVSIPWSSLLVEDGSTLPCPNGACQINLVVSVDHRKARQGHKVVVGSSDSRGRIRQGRAKVSSARLRPAGEQPASTWRSTRRTAKKVPIVAKGGSHRKTVTHSLRIGNLRAGDQLLVDVRARTGIGHLPYNALTKSQVILARKPRSTRQVGKILDSPPQVSAQNGFNCTQGRSGHPDPCTIRKGGVLSVRRASKGPWFVNVIVSHSAIGTAPKVGRWRSAHAAKVRRAGGRVTVARYRRGTHGGGAGTATGWSSFSASERPRASKPRRLVKQIARFGIRRGSYSCERRRRPRRMLVCRWRASGTFGDSPRYECNQKATWRPKSKTFQLRACRPALGAQLWQRLRANGVAPDFAGACRERKSGNFVCRWYGRGTAGALAGAFCRGDGVYVINKHRWRIDACRRS